METNPYRIEEQLWTPAPVYDVHPPNTLDYSSFDFLEGSDGFDKDAVKNSLWEGFKQFFEDAFGTLGKIVGGAIELGVGVFRAFAEGVTKLLGHLGDALGSIFGGPTITPLPPIFNPIKTNLEAALEPHLNKIENASTTIKNSLAIQQDLSTQIAALDVRMEDNFAKLEENNQEYAQIKEEFDTLSAAAAQQEAELKRINEETQKAVQNAQTVTNQFSDFQEKNKNEIDKVRRSANTAISKAEDATTALNAYKIEQSAKINSLTDTADEALRRASVIVDEQGELMPAMKQAGLDAEKALADLKALQGEYATYKTDQAKVIQGLRQQAQKGIADADTAQKAINKANADLETNVSKMISKSPEVVKAQEEARSATQALENWVEIGDSIIPYKRGTTVPVWTLNEYGDNWSLVDETLPNGKKIRAWKSPAQHGGSGVPSSERVKVKVDPDKQYLVSYWIKSDPWNNEFGPGFYTDVRNQDGKLCTKYVGKGANHEYDESIWPNRLASIYYTPPKWVYREYIMAFTEDTEWVYFDAVMFNYTWVSAGNVNKRSTVPVYIYDLKASPYIPGVDALEELSKSIADNASEIESATQSAREAKTFLEEVQGNFNQKVAEAVSANKDVQDAKSKAVSASAGVSSLNTTLRNQVDIGASLVTLVPGTRDPEWMSTVKTVTGEKGSPVEGLPVATNGGKIRKWEGTAASYVKVSDKVRYKVSFWIKTTGKSSILVGLRNSAGGGHPIDSNPEKRPEQTKNHDSDLWMYWKNGWLIGLVLSNSEWKYAEYTVQFKPGVEFVRIDSIYWSGSAGDGGVEQQWIADLRIEPDIPDQATIDMIQNNAIMQNTKVGSENANAIDVLTSAVEVQKTVNANQKKWNDAVQTTLDHQTIFNQNQSKWNTAATNAASLMQNAITKNSRVSGTNSSAIKVLEDSVITQKFINDKQSEWNEGTLAAVRANTGLIQLAFPDTDMTPRGSDSRPYWSSGLAFKGGKEIFNETPSVPAYYMPPSSSQETNTSDNAFFPVFSGVYLRVRFAIRFDSDAASTGFTLRLYGRKRGDSSATSSAVNAVRWLRVWNENWPEPSMQSGDFSSAAWMGIPTAARGDWVHYDGVARLKDDIDEVRLQFNTNANTGVIIAGPYITPYAPVQERLDSAQNTAIEALKKQASLSQDFQTKQREWNKTSATATQANTDSIRALARIDTGSSLVVYEDLTDKEIEEATKAKRTPRQYKPSWATASRFHLDSSHSWVKGNPNFTDAWGVSSSQTTLYCRHNFAKIEPGMVYKLSYWHRASAAGSKYYIQMRTPAGETDNVLIPLSASTNRTTGQTVWTEDSPTSYAVSEMEMPTSWRKVEVRFKVVENVSAIAFHAIYWNHPRGSNSANQYIAGLEFSLDVPTQADVDKAQNEALKSLSRTVHMLNRPERGASVLAYKAPNDSELENPKANPDWDIPEWTDLATMRRDMATAGSGDRSFMAGMPHETMWGVTSSTGTTEARGGWMNVEAGQMYKLSYWHRATSANTRYYIQMYGDGTGDNGSPLRVVSGKTEDGDLTFGSATSYIVANDKMSYGKWTFNEVIVKIEPNIRRLRFARFYWNHPNGTATANQWIAGLDFAVNVPSQQQVDEAQTKAIAGLQKFQDQSTTLATIQGNMLNKNEKMTNKNRTAIQILEDSVKGLDEFRSAQLAWDREQENINASVDSALEGIADLQRKQAEYIVRVMYRPANQAVYDDYISVSAGGTVTAKNAWGGEAIIDMTRQVMEDAGEENIYVDKRSIKQVHVGTSRTLLSGAWNTKDAEMIINYWVYQGTPQSKAVNCPTGYITGSSYRPSSWTEVGSITVPPTNGSTTVQWKIRLTAADRECVYGMRIKVDGQYNSSNQATWEGIGPLGPLGDGIYEMNRIFSLPLSDTKSQTLTFETYFRPGSGDGSSQAKASYNSARVMYIKSNG